MRKSIIGLVLLLMVAVPVFADEVYTFQKQGYGFIEDNSVGSLAGGVGLFEPNQTLNPPFDFDYVGYEVTWVIMDMEITNFIDAGVYHFIDFAGGTIGVYEDASFNLDYGTVPADGIATGTDGTLALSGGITTGSMVFNAMDGTGTFSAGCVFTGGTRFGELPGGTPMQEWMIFDGLTTDEITEVPGGYHTRWAGRIYTTDTVATEKTSMSSVRALY